MSHPAAVAMPDTAFASTPAPPYSAAIFTSRRTDVDAGYGEASGAMVRLAATQPGFPGVESARGDSGVGITVSHWDNEQAIAAWRRHVEHAAVREQGRTRWYEHFEVRIARVERAYAGPPQETR